MGKNNLSINPFSKAGCVPHQVGYTNTMCFDSSINSDMFSRSGSNSVLCRYPYFRMGVNSKSIKLIRIQSDPDESAPILYCFANAEYKLSLSGCPLLLVFSSFCISTCARGQVYVGTDR